ncbi:hypothetical protein IC229_23045 [Spirosoma sp. BT702]|uniref:Uncharacterized protein n=1 Tax=Spirosoma profusum TaxID=2771354 RepID=A0A927ASA6_9BACT|nr:hypothetical protein [Spirosoma profusum]MBD2703541.1 hypothetical protein [Spirosoma profusum]
MSQPFRTPASAWAPSDTLLCRCSWEAITNICKHSDATHVTMAFRESNRQLYLLVYDNGTSKKGQTPTDSAF